MHARGVRPARAAAAAVAAVAAAAPLLAGCGPESRAGAAHEGAPFERTVAVEVMEVRPTAFVEVLRVVGAAEARADVVVSAEESGVLERYFVEKGARVRRGQPIAKIDDRVLRAQAAEAEAAAKLAAERFERQRGLWEERRIGSEIAYLQAKYEAEMARARWETLRARLDRTVLRAPIAGILDARYVDEGEQVAVGTPVARVVELDRLKVTAGVPERYAGWVKEGDTARVRFDVWPDAPRIGIVRYVGHVVDERSRTFAVEIELSNANGLVKPQMIATLELPGRRLRDALVVPQDAVLRTEAGYQVYVAEPRDTGFVAVARAVRPGPSYGNRTVIAHGLRPGDRVIVRGQHQVDPGVRVAIVREVPWEPPGGSSDAAAPPLSNGPEPGAASGPRAGSAVSGERPR